MRTERQDEAIDAVLAGSFGTHYGPSLWNKTRWRNDETLRREQAGAIVDDVLAALDSKETP